MVLFWFLSCTDKKKTEFLHADRSEASLQLVNNPKFRGRLRINKWTAALLLCLHASHQYIKF